MTVETITAPTSTATVEESAVFASVTQTSSAAVLDTTAFRKRAAGLRDEVSLVQKDVQDLHGESTARDLARRTQDRLNSGVPSLLNELNGIRGMSWADIARLAGVSVGAVRKWRTGGDASGASRTALAQLAAFMDLLQELAVDDPAQWMESPLPLSTGYSIRPFDIYLEGHHLGVLDIAAQRSSAEQILDECDPDWRVNRRSEAVVELGPDGHPLLVQVHEE